MFTYFPFAKNAILSFFTIDKYRNIKSFAGIGNYLKVLSDEKFLQAIGNTLIFVLTTVPISIALGFGLALLARKRTKSSSVYEALYSMSMAISVSVVAMIFQLAFNPSMGIVKKLLGVNISWLRDPQTALKAIIFIQIWANVGYNFIFLLSSLRGMSEDVLESAKLDGCSNLQFYWRILMPSNVPVITTVFISHQQISVLNEDTVTISQYRNR